MTELITTEYSRGKSSVSLAAIVVLILGVTASVSLMSQGLPALYPLIRTELGLSRTQVGLITSFMMGTGIITALPGGWFTDKFGVKRTIMIVLVSMAVFVFALMAVSSFATLLLVVGCIGIAEGPIFPATTKAIMDWLPARVRGLAMSLKKTGVPAGGAVAAAVLPVIAVAAGWRLAAATIGVLVAMIAVIFLFTYRDVTPAEKVSATLSWSALRRICRDRSLMVIAAWGLLFTGFQFIVLSYLILFAIEMVGISPIAAGGLLAAAQVSAIIARIVWGAASDFVFKRRRVVVLGIIGVLTAVAFAAAGFIGSGASRTTIFLVAILLGTSTLSYHGVHSALLGELASVPGQMGTIIGVANTGQKIGMSLLPPLFGYLADSTGTYVAGWRVAAVIALVATLGLLLLAHEPQHR